MIKTNIGQFSLSTYQAIIGLREKHSLAIENDRMRPTTALLQDVLKIASLEIGRLLTISQAWQLWRCCVAIENNAIERDALRSEIAFWYGIDTTRISDLQLASYKANLYRVQAQKRIVEGNYDPTDYELVYSLFLIAYDDENRALKARAQSIESLMDTKR